jgi:transcriptional regulator GlxA family with amidase domain
MGSTPSDMSMLVGPGSSPSAPVRSCSQRPDCSTAGRRRPTGPAPTDSEPIAPYTAADPFGEALAWAQQNLGELITVEDLARCAAMSPRSFARRFGATTGTSPHRWISRQRVLLAQRLLETTDLSIDEVSRRCGLGTATNLRLHFANVLRSSPTAYRRTFKASRV